MCKHASNPATAGIRATARIRLSSFWAKHRLFNRGRHADMFVCSVVYGYRAQYAELHAKQHNTVWMSTSLYSHAHAHAHAHVHAHTDGMHPVRQMRLRHPLLTTILGTLAWLVSQAPHTGGGQIETVAVQIETVAARGSSGKQQHQQHQQHQQQTILAA